MGENTTKSTCSLVLPVSINSDSVWSCHVTRQNSPVSNGCGIKVVNIEIYSTMYQNHMTRVKVLGELSNGNKTCTKPFKSIDCYKQKAAPALSQKRQEETNTNEEKDKTLNKDGTTEYNIE